MTQELIQSGFITPDGVVHATKAAATDHLRRPVILDALRELTKDEAGNVNEELATWLIDNRDTIDDAFSVGTLARVSKADKAKLEKALAAVVASENKDFAFLIENHEAVASSFRWPAQKRMTAEEKEVAARNTLQAISNEQMADWVVASKEGILAAFEAGKVKAKLPEKATEGLAAYRAKKAAEKAAKEAGTYVEPSEDESAGEVAADETAS